MSSRNSIVQKWHMQQLKGAANWTNQSFKGAKSIMETTLIEIML